MKLDSPSGGHGRDSARQADQGLRGRDEGRLRLRPRDRRRRVRRLRRAVGVREDDGAADDRRARADHRRHRRDRRRGRQHAAAEGPGRGDGLPELRPLPAHVGLRQHGLRAEDARGREGRDRATRHRRSEEARALRGAEEETADALGRPAPARRDGARDRARAAGVPDGRALVEPRREATRRDARRDRPDPARPRGDDDLRHARPGRGDDDGRPGLRASRRLPPAGCLAAGALRPARQPVRRGVHRLARHESRPRGARRRRGAVR